MLSTRCLRQVLNPLAPPLRIAFFLRANSNLYTTFSNRRIRLEYYDLTRPFEALVEKLAGQRPQILVAPATVLAELARRGGDLRPEQIISVAEVLDTRDREEIERAYGVRVREVYQAAEGFLGSTCEEGRMHLNEDSLHIEPHWMDEKEDRFQPIITDFSRRTQWFVRYHLNDILRIRRDPCPCGDASLALDAIEGRADEILWARNARGQWQPVFPDALRQALYAMKQPLDLYRIEQHGHRWEIQLRRSKASLEVSIRAALEGLLTGLGLGAPEIDFRPWVEQPAVEKQRRIRCLIRPT
jgi:putative adenylate-forming enzyme